ncbi:Maf family protein [Halobacillus naozhouensis]|uniref:Nucleoside triphosphate pyrophosphatase n=2 Tax=Halobacillus naozhouensis TaxID=554880 RepID=A0ABY8ITM2_9BACI|nr:Maf family protein [Halobacillus naozhouensis]WFT73393.1 Maf family protein [Halobacillus naozhouensis]
MLQAGFSFEVRSSLLDEVISEDMNPEDVVQNLAEQKNTAISRSANEVVLTADTIVYQGTQLLGKPESYDEAYSMLKQLSGSCHKVYTGVSIRDSCLWVSFVVSTKVYFWTLSHDQIEWYLSKQESLDKAGGYGIQGSGALLVEKIEGDYFNVVGLPISKLTRELTAFKIAPG